MDKQRKARTPESESVASDRAPSAMRAVTYKRYGGPEVLEFSESARPEPEPGKVLVRVGAAGLDRGTWHLMAGEPRAVRLAVGLRAPRNPVPGIDFSGEVVAIGAGVLGFAAGDRVLGVAAGSFAEFVLADARKLVQLPEGITWERAAALPTSGVTALQALQKAGTLGPDTRMLVTGASGGVGSFVVQLAKLRGVHVSAECSAHKMEFVASLGADVVYDRAGGGAYARDAAYDVVIDIAGNPSIGTLRRILVTDGRAVIVGAEVPGPSLTGMNRQMRAVLVSPFLRQSLAMLVSVNKKQDLTALVELMSAGKLESRIDRTFRLGEAREAMEYLVAGSVCGKVVLVP
ncbi:NAD(P)-dependent alcohol dehydrogenase [Paeniglutamicibacter kerguelensis]|uniref:NADPH:quinone reductase-like Zn-dependent oxidoreductase n=1 Tax=Paeniglutamicibacter kerguelensis TaxID=254788 RepID=A0ABS4XB50_9MICC|nr:NAD(P)-dependent alcohol dehydrogenase [Paeniglutamicibacter kerguelensis]MBP2385695.1 NADPH:quinone reductase-like Zn-dependent oxidoreductase [Paeniglutamicibacter kerguelensis]